MNNSAAPNPPLSIIHGLPLDQEPGLGALTLPGYLREVTMRYAPREALVFHHADGHVERWSYAELWSRSMQIAQSLVAAGIGNGERVGVMMTNRPEWISAAFGVSLAGGVITALSTFSTQAELDYLLKSSGISVLLLEGTVIKKDFAAIIHELEPAIGKSKPGELSSTKYPFLRRIAVLGKGAAGAMQSWEDFLALGRDVPEAIVQARADSVTPADIGVLLFSSGSTGKPKGVLSAHRGVCIMCWRWRRMLATGDAENEVRAWSANGFFWSGNFAGSLGATLSSGGSNVLQATFDPAEALRLMQAEKVTRAYAWPHQYQQLAAAPNWNEVDLSSLHYVDPRTALGQHPTIKTDWVDPNAAYGNTETFTLSACFPSDTPADKVGNTHGEALPGNTLRIVDPLSGEVVPRGARGEIAVKGPTLMLGYLGIPLADTLDSEGYFRTSDGGYIDDRGRLVWEGRLNDIIKTGGANVSPIEIDGVIATAPGVKVVRCVGVPHESLGEIVVACVVSHEGATLTEASIRDFAKEQLASYKVPRRVVFVQEDELSLTGSSKIKLSDLRALAAKRLEGSQG